MTANPVRVVIAGGGIAGVPLAYAVKEKLHGRAEVTVVSDSPDFHFIPANPWIALGLRAESDVTFSLEPLLATRKIALKVAALEAIDLEGSQLHLAGGANLSYDYLVIATGIRPDWNAIPGTTGNPRIHSVIRPHDAAAAHSAYEAFLSRPGPVVIAAAPRVPTIGPMYEYAFLLDSDSRRRALRQRVPITLITPEPYPGHVGLDKPVAREELGQALETQGIEWIGNAALRSCEGGRISFHALGGSPQGTLRQVDFDYAMIWPPFRGVEAVERCKAICDEDGLIIVDEYQRATGRHNVFAVGACTAKEVLTHTVVPVGAPDAVYVIQQQVAIVADNIAHSLRGEPLNRGSIEREQWIADTGKRGAAYLASPQMPLRNIQWLHQGRWVYEAKRDFEDFFINQILFGAGQHGQVQALIRRLRSQQQGGHRRTRNEKLGAQMPLGIDARRRLEVLARELGVDASAFSQQLLERALAEALSCLDPQARERVSAELHARLISELEGERERVRFEGGAP
ncbi:MAG TPA: FAD/NAD(P)-binding oxidoreductase [Steroidobacteraceae bacterium]